MKITSYGYQCGNAIVVEKMKNGPKREGESILIWLSK